jgi:hypothetical protein
MVNDFLKNYIEDRLSIGCQHKTVYPVGSCLSLYTWCLIFDKTIKIIQEDVLKSIKVFILNFDLSFYGMTIIHETYIWRNSGIYLTAALVVVSFYT